jgi:hypothetical protein
LASVRLAALVALEGEKNFSKWNFKRTAPQRSQI